MQGDVFNVGPKRPITNRDIIQAFTDPESVVEKYWPGALEVLKAKGFKIKSENFWPVANIRKAKLILGWEPELTFESWLLDNGWKKP